MRLFCARIAIVLLVVSAPTSKLAKGQDRHITNNVPVTPSLQYLVSSNASERPLQEILKVPAAQTVQLGTRSSVNMATEMALSEIKSWTGDGGEGACGTAAAVFKLVFVAPIAMIIIAASARVLRSWRATHGEGSIG